MRGRRRLLLLSSLSLLGLRLSLLSLRCQIILSLRVMPLQLIEITHDALLTRLDGWTKQNHLPVLPHVPCRSGDHVWVVLQEADALVAGIAENPADLASHMVMIYAPTDAFSLRRLADRAPTALAGKHRLELFMGEAVPVEPFAWPHVVRLAIRTGAGPRLVAAWGLAQPFAAFILADWWRKAQTETLPFIVRITQTVRVVLLLATIDTASTL